jgi:hypothetical protein
MSPENKGWRKLRARIEESTTKQIKALRDRIGVTKHHTDGMLSGEGLTSTERELILLSARKIARKHAIKVERDRRRESEEPKTRRPAKTPRPRAELLHRGSTAMSEPDKPVERDEFTLEEAGRMIADHLNAVLRKPPPTAEQINKANREFNNKIAPVVEQLTKLDEKRLLHPDGVAQLRISAAHHVELRSAEQSARGQRRRGTRDPLKAAVVHTMRLWRREGHTRDAYIEAAGVGSVRGVTIQKVGDWYIVDCDKVSDSDAGRTAKRKQVGRRIRYGTLKDWWTEAGRA